MNELEVLRTIAEELTGVVACLLVITGLLGFIVGSIIIRWK